MTLPVFTVSKALIPGMKSYCDMKGLEFDMEKVDWRRLDLAMIDDREDWAKLAMNQCDQNMRKKS